MASLSSTRSTTSPRFGRTTSPPLNLNFNTTASKPNHLKLSNNFFLESNDLNFTRTPTFPSEKSVNSQLQGEPMGTL